MGAKPSEPIGLILREKREQQGLTLEDAEKATRIRARFLSALEADDFASLPSSAQVRGFLNIYAQFLGLNSQQVLQAYDAGRKRPHPLIPPPAARSPARPIARSAPPIETPRPAAAPRPAAQAAPQPAAGRAPVVRSRRPRWLSVDVFVGVTFTLALGGFLVWGGLEFIGGKGFAPVSTSTHGPTAVIAPTATPQLAAASPTVPLPTPRAVYDGVNLIVRAEQRTWVRVVVDGAEAFAGLMPPGTSKEFNGQTMVELDTGNGLGTHVLWNGQDQGTLGQIGEVVIRLWTREGAMTPTPSLTPIPSATPTPSATPKP